MNDDYRESLEKLDKRIGELERDWSEMSGLELSRLRAEVERLKAMRPEAGNVPAAGSGALPGAIVPDRPEITGDIGRVLEEPSSDRPYEHRKPHRGGQYRGLRDPIARKSAYQPGRGPARATADIRSDARYSDYGGRVRMSEMTVGKYVVGILAGVLVLLAVCVGIGLFWPYVPDPAKFFLVFAAGTAMSAAGEYRILARKAGLNGFWQALAGCGFMVVFVALTAGFAVWYLYGVLAIGILYMSWFCACFTCAGKNGSRLFYALAYAGGLMAAQLARFSVPGPDAIGQALVCVIPVLVILLGLADAFRTDDSFLWFLNAVSAGLSCVSLVGWSGRAGAYGIVQVAYVALAVVLLYCSQRLFKSDGAGMAVLRTASTFMSCCLLAESCGAAFGWVGSVSAADGAMVPASVMAGHGAALALILTVFVLTDMPGVMALGSMPVSAVMVAEACGAIPFVGQLIPMIVSVIALGSGYGLRGKLENLAVVLFPVIALTGAFPYVGAYYDQYVLANLLYMAVIAMAYVVGYRARRSRSVDRYDCLFLIVSWMWVNFYYGGAWCMPDGTQTMVLAAGAAVLGWHYFDMAGGSGRMTNGMRAASAVMALCWAGGVLASGYGVLGLVGRTLVLVGVPALMLAAGSGRGATGVGMQLLIAWCDAGIWIAALSAGMDVPVAACGLATACASAAVIWYGFRARRKDIRVTGLTLTVLHVLAVAGSVALRGGTIAIVLSLLGAGLVCFAVSFAYNRLSVAYGDDAGGEDPDE